MENLMMQNKNSIIRLRKVVTSLTLVVCLFTFLFASMVTVSSVSAAERLAISVNTANVRSGPGTNFQALWRMEKYTPIKVVSRQGKWIFFEDFEGTQGWMRDDLVDNTPTVITIRGKGNIRSSPGTNHEIIFQAESGVPFKVIQRRGEWLNIKHADGDTGWIHSSLVW
jgi:SH3-like domain-containing protein